MSEITKSKGIKIDLSDLSARERYFGDSKFYKMVLTVAIPIMIQNGITNFVNLLDNIMVGRIGTEQMAGVSIVNQLLMVYHLCIFGALAGAGIFTAQYFGYGDMKGVRDTVRYKLWISTIMTTLALVVLFVGGSQLIGLYLQGSADGGSLEETLGYGMTYLHVIMFEFPAFMLVQVYAGTLRECGETMTPMKAGMIAVFINLVLNYILIYGKFGAPALGVAGAAIATTISHYCEAAIVIIFTYRRADKFAWVKGLFRSLKVPLSLTKSLIIKGTPLLLNETLWSTAMAFQAQCYSISGLNAVAAINIANTVNMLFGVALISLGSAVGIIVGQQLGAGKMKEAKITDDRMIVFSVLFCLLVAVIMAVCSPAFPGLYNTSEEVRILATEILWVYALFMPVQSYVNAAYFTLRCGGKTFITFLFDSAFMCVVNLPLAYLLSRFTSLPITWIIALVSSTDFVKCVIGHILIKKNVWMVNLTQEQN